MTSSKKQDPSQAKYDEIKTYIIEVTRNKKPEATTQLIDLVQQKYSLSKEEIIKLYRTPSLSLGMSLALVPLVGLALNYTPWGIRLTPITLSLLALTVISATAALLREFQTKTTKPTNQTHS